MIDSNIVKSLNSSEPLRVLGWAQCRKMLSGTYLVSDPSLVGLVSEPTNNMLLMDGEIHKAVRRIVISYLTRTRLVTLSKRLSTTANELVRSAINNNHVDLVSELVEPLVLDAIMTVMDVPVEYRPKLTDWLRSMLGVLEPDLPRAARLAAINAALRATLLFERDGTIGRATGLHAVLEEAAHKGEIPVKLARSTPVVLLHGGYENPLNQLACVTAWAVENPKRFHELASSKPALMFEEILRRYSPVRKVARRAAMDGIIDGKPVEKGELVWVDLESANTDIHQFTAKNDFDSDQTRSHLGFGYGKHKCPGAALARMEGLALIQSLRQFSVDDLQLFKVEWRDGVVARGPASIKRR